MFRINVTRVLVYLALILVGMSMLLVACASPVNPEIGDINPGDTLQKGKDLIATVYPYPIPKKMPAQPIKILPIELPGDPVFIDVMEIIPSDEAPSGYALRLVGTIPTPCHELRINVLPPNEEGRINVVVFADSDPGVVCIQIIEEFDITYPLEVFDPAKNTVWVNEEQVVEIR